MAKSSFKKHGLGFFWVFFWGGGEEWWREREMREGDEEMGGRSGRWGDGGKEWWRGGESGLRRGGGG